MRNLFDAAAAGEIEERLQLLGPTNERQWGKMTAAQAMAHCSLSLDWATGAVVPEKMFFAQIVGRLIKNKVLGDDAPMRRNTPTAKSLIVETERELEDERARLAERIDRFATGGTPGCTSNPHSFFGPMTPQQWAILMYKHVDHHLRQFGV